MENLSKCTCTHLKTHAQTEISVTSALCTPPPILYRSLWDLKHGNPISLVSFLGKRHAPWSMWESAYPPQLNQGGSAFIYPPAQGFLGISDGFSWSIFKYPPPQLPMVLVGRPQKTHTSDKSARRPSCWHSGNTLETDAIGFFFFFFFFFRVLFFFFFCSAAWDVCNEIFFS